jgi:DNA primase
MSKSSFIDFKAVKAVITMEQVLEHYGIFNQFKRNGKQLTSSCPIHKGGSPTQFSVNTDKNVWKCFSPDCKRGGNTLDFIAQMERVSIHAAANKAVEWFHLDREIMSAKSDEERPSEVEKGEVASAQKPAPRQPAPVAEKITPNAPLKFRLDKLEREHPYLVKERGLTLETIVDFGIGFCAKGMMAGRIAIPICNPEGNVVAYAGRFPGEPTEENPKYKLPQGFRKSQELFNIDRAIKESAEKPLVIVEGFFDAIKLHQNGWRKVVALMGSTMSDAQEELIRRHTDSRSRVIVMLDEDEAGRTGRDDIACRLSKFCFVKTHVFDEPDTQPEQLFPEDLVQILEEAA